jgi:two-component system response regulator PilR (NtrC family)
MAPDTRILVVDDERLIRMSLRMVLKDEGYQVDTAATVAEALDMLDRFAYQILITDLELPDGSGIGIIHYALKRNDTLQTILFTGSGNTVDENEALIAGVGAIVHKPCELSVVISATRKAARSNSDINTGEA